MGKGTMSKEKDFTKLIREHEGILFKITTMYTSNRQDQNDLYQDIVYQLWRSFDSFRNESRITTWMYRVAMNTAITSIRRNKKHKISIPIEKVVLNHIDSDNRELEEKLKILYHHIHKLGVLDKGLMLLLLEGKKYEEIAEITGLSKSNVGTRISRIKQKLQSKIKS